MTRIYLSPTASAFAKIGLFFVECLIGLYNLITFPIRKITLKVYSVIFISTSILCAISVYFNSQINTAVIIGALALFTVSIFITRAIYKYLNKKVSPRVAFLMNSPLGIPLNKFYRSAY